MSAKAPKKTFGAQNAVSVTKAVTRGLTLHSANYYNGNGSARWLHMFDANAKPADTAVPLMIVEVPAGQTGTIDYGEEGRPFVVGICFVNSTSATTLTAGSADGFFDVVYS